MDAVKVLVKGQIPFSETLSKREKMSLAGGSQPHFLHAPAGIAKDDIESQLTAVRPDILFLNSLQGSRDQDLETVGRIRRADARLPLLMSVDEMDHPSLVSLMEKGVTDFVMLPLRPVDLLLRIQRLGKRLVRDEPVRQAAEQSGAGGMHGLLGENALFREEIRKIPTVADCEATVLIQGETGTGKEMCARTLHDLSRRAHMPFVPVNCGAIPADLVENELFGHEREAFTGATTGKAGLIREAQGGTLFLDEVDSLPLLAQVKLLRFLQEKEYRPLGATRSVKADVRVVGASNTPLEVAVAQGRVRKDLYYRLNVVSVQLPPLRERKEDIPMLVRHFLNKYMQEYGKTDLRISGHVLQELTHYAWPGNVRELQHVVQRAVILSERPLLEFSSFLSCREKSGIRKPESLKSAKARLVQDFEERYIRELLSEHAGNISHAAVAAGKNRREFWQLIKKYRIASESFRANPQSLEKVEQSQQAKQPEKIPAPV